MSDAERQPSFVRRLLVGAVALTALAGGAAATQRLVTYAAFSDFSVSHVQVVADGWESTPPECAGMVFDKIIEGTPGDDVLYGTNKADLILGFSGNDKLYGGNGDDCLVGGPGDDQLDGGNGRDVLIGGAGKDSFDAGNGKDALYGGPDDDTLLGHHAPDLLDGGDGVDTCTGEPTGGVVNCEVSDEAP